MQKQLNLSQRRQKKETMQKQLNLSQRRQKKEAMQKHRMFQLSKLIQIMIHKHNFQKPLQEMT
ncbi:hypothetical protein AZ906_11465 [Staphylococcus epidermidis]|nr:hypothetical protein AZ906_11465 [Staphylococcus epidermidis]